VLGIGQQLVSTLQNYVTNGAPPAAAPPAGPPPGQYRDPGTGQYVAPPQPTGFDPEEYVQGKHLAALAQGYVQQYVGADLMRTQAMIAESNLEQVKREYPEDFQRYGPEILTNLANLSDKRLWSIDNLKKVVRFVRSDHVDELIARGKAEQGIAEMGPTFRSSGANGVSIPTQQPQYTLRSEALPGDWKERAAKAGLTEAALDEFCTANSMSREDFFKSFEKTAITEVSRRG
jgi:hypothetical protein